MLVHAIGAPVGCAKKRRNILEAHAPVSLTILTRHAEYQMPEALLSIARTSFLIIGALFPIVNPVSSAPIFLNLTQGYSTQDRGVLSRKIAINGFFLLIGSILIGTHILHFFGISLPVVQAAGGIVIISTGWSLLNQQDHQRREKGISSEDMAKRAFYPLTLPLTVGPGSISVAITLGANVPHAGGMVNSLIASLIGSLLIGLSIYISYRSAERIERLLGDVAMSVISRLSSFILFCIGVQILWNGIKALLATQNLR
jgi:multiple antibiotic resistance protein